MSGSRLSLQGNRGGGMERQTRIFQKAIDGDAERLASLEALVKRLAVTMNVELARFV